MNNWVDTIFYLTMIYIHINLLLLLLYKIYFFFSFFINVWNDIRNQRLAQQQQQQHTLVALRSHCISIVYMYIYNFTWRNIKLVRNLIAIDNIIVVYIVSATCNNRNNSIPYKIPIPPPYINFFAQSFPRNDQLFFLLFFFFNPIFNLY